MPRTPLKLPGKPKADNSIEALEQGLRIDEHALEQSCQEQPENFYRVAKALALATSRRDAAKQLLDETEAEADINIREEANRDERKLTDKAVEAHKLLDPHVHKATRELAEFKKEVALLTALKEAYSNRGYALKDLVSLYVSNYFGSDINSKGHSDSAIKTADARVARERQQEMRRNRVHDN